MFSKGVSSECKGRLIDILNIREVDRFSKYLGLLAMLGKSKKAMFGYLKERLAKRIGGWQETNLSRGGKEVLIKSIAQAIPLYVMSCLLVPKTLCVEIQQLVARFWWSNDPNKSRIHWSKWENLCLSKQCGGLGFRNLQAFNLALPAKQVWRLIENRNSLCAQVFKYKYHPRHELLSAKIGYRPSQVWRSIMTARRIVIEGPIWRIGTGHSVDILDNRWVEGIPCNRPLTTYQAPPTRYVSCLINLENHSWRHDLIHQCFPGDVAEAIIHLSLCSDNGVDRLYWRETKSGQYSVKTGYRIAIEDQPALTDQASPSTSSSEFWKNLRSLNLPPKVIHTVWVACKGFLPCNSTLLRRRIIQTDKCWLCGDPGESILHLFRNCRHAKEYWKGSTVPLKAYKVEGQNCMDWLWRVSSMSTIQEFATVCGIVWLIWVERNRVAHQQLPLGSVRGFTTLNELMAGCSASKQCEMLSLARDGEGSAEALDSVHSWLPPEETKYKINTDAAFIPRGNTSAFGFLIRNKAGLVMMSGGGPPGSSLSSLHAELQAILAYLQYSKDAGFHSLTLATDSLEAVKLIETKFKGPNWLGLLVSNILEVSLYFQVFKVVHEHRLANIPAHKVAACISACIRTDVTSV